MTWPSIQKDSEFLRRRIVWAQRAEWLRRHAFSPFDVFDLAA